MVRSERLIKLDYSWFSAKFIQVKRLIINFRGKALDKVWGHFALHNLFKLRILTNQAEGLSVIRL